MMMMMQPFSRTVTVVILLFASLFGPPTAHAYDQSLNDCKLVAAQFRNTCQHGNYDTAATSVDAMESETVHCQNNPQCIAAGTLGNDGTTCSWERKLCVTCHEVNNVVKIRVQTNNLPDHCIQSSLAKAQNFDYEVMFNRKETMGNWIREWDTQADVNNAVCPIQKQYDATSLGIVEYGDEELQRAMAFAINGVAFQFANQIREDPVYPITITNEQPLDICLGHNQRNSPSGMYHYHGVSPCIQDPNNFLKDKSMSSCLATPDCEDDTVSWALSGFDNSKTVIGLAKFGQVLYGPYDDSGRLWQAEDVDSCNGAWSEDGSDYFYVMTQWHPYAVGCQGPSNLPHNFYPQCSLNGMDQYTSSNVLETTEPSSAQPQPTTPTTQPTIAQPQPTTPTAQPTTEPTSSGNRTVYMATTLVATAVAVITTL